MCSNGCADGGGRYPVRRRRRLAAAQGGALGIFDAVDGQVLIYIHKEAELDDVERRYPAAHYVLVDDKPRIWLRSRRLGRPRDHRACPAGRVCPCPGRASYRVADLAVERIGDLLDYELPAF